MYIIKSEEGLIYTGITKDLEKRLQEHNYGRSYYTKRGSNWKVIYSERYDSSDQARKREKYFNNNAGKEWLKRRRIL
ncbi:GIY-YIG nuclease family protein [bacterium]|nr:GIY-YIG nuclease family protein [bacterium]